MKINYRVFFVVLIFASTDGWAGEPQSLPSPLKSPTFELLQEPALSLFIDFRSRVQTALESRELAGIVALYQTNGVTAEELNSEVARWQRMLGQDPKSVSVFLKELSRLPPESHRFWSAQVPCLTQHEVTHFAFVRCQSGQLILPSVVFEDKLLFVPSEKIRAGIKPNGAANGSPPIRSETAGSRR